MKTELMSPCLALSLDTRTRVRVLKRAQNDDLRDIALRLLPEIDFDDTPEWAGKPWDPGA